MQRHDTGTDADIFTDRFQLPERCVALRSVALHVLSIANRTAHMPCYTVLLRAQSEAHTDRHAGAADTATGQ